MKTKNIYNYLWLACIFFVPACSKNEEYGLRPAAHINFYNAAEVLQQNNSGLQNDNMVFINDSVPNQVFESAKFPTFGSTYAVASTPRQYPNQMSDLPTGSTVVSPTGYQYMYYMALKPESYRFIYTGGKKVFWQDTTLNLSNNSFTQLYLTEDVLIDRYRIIAVPDERSGIPGKVKIRVVHLSADTEPLKIARINANGSADNTGFLSELDFGAYTNYVALDTAGAAKQLNQVVLGFSQASTPEQQLLSVSVPAESGGSFTVLICGLQSETRRRAITGYDPNAQPIYTEHIVNPNLRTVLRKNY